MTLEAMKEAGKRYLRYQDLVVLGVINSRPTLSRWIRRGKFPKPIYPDSTAYPLWVIDEIITWEGTLKNKRD